MTEKKAKVKAERAVAETKQTVTEVHALEPADGEWPGAFAVYWQVFQQIRRNPGPAVLFVALYAVFSLFSSLLQGGKAYGSAGYQDYESVLQLAFVLALPTYALALADRKHISIGDVTAMDWARYFSVFLATILFLLIIGGSLILLIVPVIWAYGWFTFYQFPIVEGGFDIVGGFRESRRLARGHVAQVWGIIGVSLVWALPAVLLILVPYVVAPAYLMFIAVLSYGANARLYRHLQQLGGGE